MLKKKSMTDGIKRDPYARTLEDSRRTEADGTTTRFRRLRWSTKADGDGKTEPPTMDEVWRGRRMVWDEDEVVLTGAPPEWCDHEPGWEVVVRLPGGHGITGRQWTQLRPITPTTRLTVETTNPEALRRLLGNEHKIVEEDDG